MMLSTILIYLGLIFIAVGTFGLFFYKNFFSRVLLASQIDTLGFIIIMIGIIISKGVCFFSLKILLIMFIALIISPLNTHAITRSAYTSGFKIGKGKNKNVN